MSKITTLSSQIGEMLQQLGWTVTTAESCTGGGIATALTEVAGSSAYFNGALVTYSNEIKHQWLGVSQETLETHGAVSESTVEQMAQGALTEAQANMAIAVSGIAGPGGGTEFKPVGTVWIAIAFMNSISSAKTTVWSHRFLFEGDRKSIRESTVEASLIKACEILAEKISEKNEKPVDTV